jgi:hypothetical protein
MIINVNGLLEPMWRIDINHFDHIFLGKKMPDWRQEKKTLNKKSALFNGRTFLLPSLDSNILFSVHFGKCNMLISSLPPSYCHSSVQLMPSNERKRDFFIDERSFIWTLQLFFLIDVNNFLLLIGVRKLDSLLTSHFSRVAWRSMPSNWQRKEEGKKEERSM